MKKLIYFCLFVLFLLLISFPTINNAWKIIEVKPLHGAFVPLEEPVLTDEHWFSGEFQSAFSLWLEENIGLRPFFIRAYNQARFSVFNESPDPDIIIGKDRVLYPYGYYSVFRGYYGMGSEIAHAMVGRIKLIQDHLAANGTPFLYVMAPGKASVYNEFLPAYLDGEPCDTTNHRLVARECVKQDVNHIDFQSYFLSMKDTMKYPLFPSGGVHWTGYAASLAADTIFRFLEEISGKDLRDFSNHPGYTTDRDFIWTDNDIERSLNLLFPMKAWELYYPEVRFEQDTSRVKDKILIIGDSFTQSLFFFEDYFGNLFTPQSQFWPGYSHAMWYDENRNGVIDWEFTKEQLLNSVTEFDFVLILTTETHTYNFGFGFVDDYYHAISAKNM